jgi:hypothetical protein
MRLYGLGLLKMGDSWRIRAHRGTPLWIRAKNALGGELTATIWIRDVR